MITGMEHGSVKSVKTILRPLPKLCAVGTYKKCYVPGATLRSTRKKQFSMIASRLLVAKKTAKRESAGRDYNRVWYCLRLGSTDTFPDGRLVPVQRYKTSKPIWIKIGEGISWATAITFGPTKSIMEEAAEDFGAERIVWLDEKNRTDFSENCQNTQLEKKGGG